MAEDGFTLRTGTAADHDEIYRVLQLAFNDDPDDADKADERLVYEPERAPVTRAGDTIAGVAGAYTRDMAVPGGTVAAGHVTTVSVDPAYTRRGIRTRMMPRQPADIRGLGIPIA